MIRSDPELRLSSQKNLSDVMKRLIRVLGSLVLVLFTGCFVATVPRLGRQVTYGAAIGPEEVRFIQPHQTTREDVIASFGEQTIAV